MGHLWLRAEHKKSELRTPLIPSHAKLLLNEGHRVTIEQSSKRIFPVQAYYDAGCDIVPEGIWKQAPRDTYILGLKNLPESAEPLAHKHIYFAHAYKGQSQARSLLQRFIHGGGTLYDLEYLVDDQGKRVAAFGFYAGIVGAALSVILWCYKMLGEKPPYKIDYPCSSYHHLLAQAKSLIALVGRKPSVLIIGARGRCGTGATQFLREVDLKPLLWGRKETTSVTMSHEMLSHDILLNCIFVDETTSPFLTSQDFVFNRALSVIGDISCEPDHECNPLPFYTKTTSFDNPTLRVWEKNQTVDLISIDNLPTFLPLEASAHFSGQLITHLSRVLKNDAADAIWRGAESRFNRVVDEYFPALTRKII